MNFQIKAVVNKLLKSGTNPKGSWYLYLIKDTNARNNKSWTMFTHESLNENSLYDISGYISESPDARFMDKNGKQSYRCVFNGTEFKNLNVFPSETVYKKDPFMDINLSKEPSFNLDEQIPF